MPSVDEHVMSLGHLKRMYWETVCIGYIAQYAVKYSQVPTERKDVYFLVCPQNLKVLLPKGVGTDHQG